MIFRIFGIPMFDNELDVIEQIGFFRWAELKLDWRKLNANRKC